VTTIIRRNYTKQFCHRLSTEDNNGQYPDPVALFNVEINKPDCYSLLKYNAICAHFSTDCIFVRIQTCQMRETYRLRSSLEAHPTTVLLCRTHSNSQQQWWLETGRIAVYRRELTAIVNSLLIITVYLLINTIITISEAN